MIEQLQKPSAATPFREYVREILQLLQSDLHAHFTQQLPSEEVEVKAEVELLPQVHFFLFLHTTMSFSVACASAKWVLVYSYGNNIASCLVL